MTREEAIEVLQRGLDILGEYADSDLGEAHRMAISALSENKGEWREDSFCSKCGWFHENEEGEIEFWDSNFCPNCGADMRPEPYKAESEEV